MMDKTKQPGIICKNIVLKEIEFKRFPEYKDKPELKVEFRANSIFSEDKKRLLFELSAHIFEEKETPIFDLSCTVVGLFHVSEDSSNMTLEEYAEYSAPATLMPFLRENVSNTTMRGGLKPFFLPPLNIHSLVENAEVVSKEREAK